MTGGNKHGRYHRKDPPLVDRYDSWYFGYWFNRRFFLWVLFGPRLLSLRPPKPAATTPVSLDEALSRASEEERKKKKRRETNGSIFDVNTENENKD